MTWQPFKMIRKTARHFWIVHPNTRKVAIGYISPKGNMYTNGCAHFAPEYYNDCLAQPIHPPELPTNETPINN